MMGENDQQHQAAQNSGSGSQVQADRAAASIAIAEEEAQTAALLASTQAQTAAAQLAYQQQKDQERAKLIKMGMYGVGALVLIKILKGR